MKTRAALFLAFTSALFSVATGCSAPSADETPAASTEELRASTLKDITVPKGQIGEDGSVRVAYLPSNAYPQGATAPVRVFLGVKVPAAANGEARTVKVAGNFPGEPRVLVVDQDFVVHDAGTGVAGPAGVEATVTIPQSFGSAMVLVRDMAWVEPMEFDVSVLQ